MGVIRSEAGARSRWRRERTRLWSAPPPGPEKQQKQPWASRLGRPRAPWGSAVVRSAGGAVRHCAELAEGLRSAGPPGWPRPCGLRWTVAAGPLAGVRLGGAPIGREGTERQAAGKRGQGPGGAKVKRARLAWDSVSSGTDRAVEVTDGAGGAWQLRCAAQAPQPFKATKDLLGDSWGSRYS
ncbi:hypothetical protein NDU88_005426 [Pleurodeles waltl]|uniref:Uncharacterized protein n=1 Tax=Pleurodeles waltl TaxID=8319 RepID=A0AAV7NMR7_PLEWA|nr:hypothetical protein NDU88_005426 [Pleurodeles waltl]